jgi:DNA-directed RNA polymerase specialized sigma24 family protein
MNRRLNEEVTGNWGAPIEQAHPIIYYLAPTGAESRRLIQPVRSRISMDLQHDPKNLGDQHPGGHRAVILLHYLEDFDLAEIADITGVPLGTVKSRLHHARRKLRQQLAPELRP